MSGYRLNLIGYHANLLEERLVGTREEAQRAARSAVAGGAASRVDVFRLTAPDTYGEWIGVIDAAGFAPRSDRRAWSWE